MPDIASVEDATVRMIAAIDGGLSIIDGAQGAANAAHADLGRYWNGGSSAAAVYNTGLIEWMSGLQRVENALRTLNTELGDYRSMATNAESYAEERGRWAMPTL